MPTRPARKTKETPAPLTPEELAQTAREVVRSSPGIRAPDLKKKLPKPAREQHAEVLALLHEMAATGGVFRYVSAKAERFFAADPVGTLDRVAPEVLASRGPLDATSLKKAVIAAAPGHEEPFAQWMKTAVRRRVIFEHGPAPKSRAKRFGATVDVTRALAKVLVELRKALPALDSAGVARALVAEALRSELGLPGAPAAPAEASSVAPAAPASEDTEIVRAALAAMAAEDRPNALLLVRQLRARTPLDKARFDAATLALSRDGAAVLHHHDSPLALSPEEREALVHDGRGTYYVGIAPRSRA